MRKAVLLVVAVVFLVLALSGVALAASPQEIYDDYAADGKLDGKYTDEELEAYLDDALIDKYGDPAIVAELDTLVTSMLGDDHEEFPFTGSQLFLIALVALAFIGGGVGLRRLARSRG